MTATTTLERELDSTPPPLLAHLGPHAGVTVALCGARIMGIPAGADYPHICVVCKALDESRMS